MRRQFIFAVSSFLLSPALWWLKFLGMRWGYSLENIYWVWWVVSEILGLGVVYNVLSKTVENCFWAFCYQLFIRILPEITKKLSILSVLNSLAVISRISHLFCLLFLFPGSILYIRKCEFSNSGVEKQLVYFLYVPFLIAEVILQIYGKRF